MAISQIKGYLKNPLNNNGKKVLVLHAWWGLNDTIKHYCDNLASEGFIVFAPDLYHGKLTDQIEIAEQYSNELRLDQARIDLENVLKIIHNQAPNSDQEISVIGFSLGAYLALDLSTTLPTQISKVVVYYGTGPDDYAKAKASYLGHFSEFDPYEPESNIEELENAFKKSKRPYTFYTYPNTGHWFCEPDRTDAYNEEATMLAWERTLSFLTQP